MRRPASTNFGTFSARAFTRARIRFIKVSMIAGATMLIAVISDINNVTRAATNVGPAPAITSAKATIPCATAWNAIGIKPIRPATIATKAAVPAAPATLSASNPAEKASIPTPAAIIPTPSNATATPKSRSVGITGVKTRPAKPITTNMPASMRRPFPISSQDIFPNAKSTGPRRANEPATIPRAIAPAIAPLMRYIAPAMIRSPPARVTRPLTISSQDIPAIF